MTKGIIFLAGILMITGCGRVSNPTPPQPDPRPIIHWSGRTVNSTEGFSSQIIYCTGNISIESGGSLTLANTGLYISNEANTRYGIYVNPGGSLYIKSQSVIAAYNSAEGYPFWYKSGSSGNITSSTIESAWTGDLSGKSQFNEAGIFIEADDFGISQSVVKEVKGNGIETLGANGFSAEDTKFINNGANGLLVRNSNNIEVSGCTLSNNGTDTSRTDGCGLIFLVSNGTIESNTVENNRFTGIEGSGEMSFNINNNQVNNNGDFGIFLHDEFNTSSAVVHNNSIGSNALTSQIHAGLCIEGTIEVYAYDNLIKNNYIGVRVLNNSLVSTLESNNISDNITHGVHIDNANPIIHQNDLSGNNNGIWNDSSSNINAENNYWGYTTLAEIHAYNFNATGTIDVTPWLTSAP
ncbi:MAG: right-handed parallel beta-helix repeat-containing protein [Candidatus Margulisiibacteriota bacterium]|nr:right-handed parallel beta-helix repeat-containing protein [Candidatus Margulisiibacteriota bacterium]